MGHQTRAHRRQLGLEDQEVSNDDYESWKFVGALLTAALVFSIAFELVTQN